MAGVAQDAVVDDVPVCSEEGELGRSARRVWIGTASVRAREIFRGGSSGLWWWRRRRASFEVLRGGRCGCWSGMR